jgi:hypothetical protein
LRKYTYCSSSLSATIIDETYTNEPLKEYSLRYILRYGKGEFIPQEESQERLEELLDQELSQRQREEIETFNRRTVGTFVVQGWRDTPVNISLEDYREVATWRSRCPTEGSEVDCLPKMMNSPTLKDLSGGIRCSGFLELEDELLAQNAHGTRSSVRQRFGLGPYANIYPDSYY